MDIREIVKNFDFDGELLDVREFGSGHINRTFIAEYTDNRYVVQKINTTVFKNPDELMQNVFAVTDYLREVIEANGGDSERETLHFIKTLDGDNYFKNAEDQSRRKKSRVINRAG